MQFVIPVDAQGVVIAWIDAQLASVYGSAVGCDSVRPAKFPARFVQVVRTGGSDDGVALDSPTIEVASFVRGSNDAEAFRLAHAVAAVIRAMDGERVGDTMCFGVGVASGAANLPDPTTPTHQRVRQAFTLDLRMRVIDA